MPNREFIHSTADVVSTIRFALDSGFQVISDEAQPDPAPHFLVAAEAATISCGVFFLCRPEWIYGPFQTMEISGGHNRGKHFVQPRVNHASIQLYFGGERLDQRSRRLGGGQLSSYPESLELPAKVLRPTPEDVNAWFKRLARHMFSGIVVRGGVHYYRVCREVLADPEAAECLPPFDYIPWGIQVLHSANRSRKKE